MSGSFDEFTQGWTRSLIILCILIPIGIITKSYKKISVSELHWWFMYAIPGSLVIPFYYFGFTHLSIGTATLVFYASLTLTSYMLGFAFFREKMTWIKGTSLLLGLAGLGIIYSRSVLLHASDTIPIIVTIFSGFCGGIEVVFTKKLSDRYTPIQLTTFLFIISFILCAVIVMLFPRIVMMPIELTPWIGNILHALATIAAFFLVVKGFTAIEPSVGGILGLMEIIFGIVFGIILFKEQVTPEILYGGICIVLAASLPNISALRIRHE